MNVDDAAWPQMIVGNVVVDLMDRELALSLISESGSSSIPLVVASANLHHIHLFAAEQAQPTQPSGWPANRSSAELRWLTLLDGVPLVRTAAARSGVRWPKLSGSDLIEPILQSAATRGVPVGFLGGSAETHRQLAGRLRAQSPAVDIAGTWAPDRAQINDPAESARIAAEIKTAGVSILVVSLGKPLQEQWITQFGPATGASVMLAFGAAADFLTERVRRAPGLVSALGAEWTWRLMLEPRRLGRRYLIDGPPAWLLLKRHAKVVQAAEEFAAPNEERGCFVGAGQRADVTVVTVTYNSARDISGLIDDLRVTAVELRMRFIIVDNGSVDDTVHIARLHQDITVAESGGNLGYAGGINVGLALVGDCDAIFIINPDLRLAPRSVAHLLSVANGDRTGAVVPLILDEEGRISPSIYREPSVFRAVCDAFLGGKIQSRPAFSSEFDLRLSSYSTSQNIDWATGAALMVPFAVALELGPWNEQFFLYSEEVDYFRRIRESGRRVRFEPRAKVKHRGGGSGRSAELVALKSVNRVRYVELYHGRVYTALYRAAVALAEGLRSYNRAHRHTLAIVMNRTRWKELPRGKSPLIQELSGARRRGSVIVPACNEANVIRRTLDPLSKAAVDGYIELIVMCNGCTDETAEIARRVPGAQVFESEQGSKPAALNAGDSVATMWPRVYLDADVEITATAILAVLDRLRSGDVMVASPDCQFDWKDSSAAVRCYYRAALRVQRHKLTMWRAGVYGLNEKGHSRFNSFPDLVGDDLFIDQQFESAEKAIVTQAISTRKTPADAKSLLTILRRWQRGGDELRDRGDDRGADRRHSALTTAFAVVATICGPRSAVDATVFLALAIAARSPFGKSDHLWERDESSRALRA